MVVPRGYSSKVMSSALASSKAISGLIIANTNMKRARRHVLSIFRRTMKEEL
jgi:hypothetical protein